VQQADFQQQRDDVDGGQLNEDVLLIDDEEDDSSFVMSSVDSRSPPRKKSKVEGTEFVFPKDRSEKFMKWLQTGLSKSEAKDCRSKF